MRFSPNFLGLNVKIFRTIFGQSRTEFSNRYWIVCAVFMCYYWKNELHVGCMKNHVDICLYDVMT